MCAAAETRALSAMQVLHALDYLHADCGLIHTDLKPENVMLRRSLRPRTVQTAATDEAQTATPREPARPAAPSSGVAAERAAASPAQPSPAVDTQASCSCLYIVVQRQHTSWCSVTVQLSICSVKDRSGSSTVGMRIPRRSNLLRLGCLAAAHM